MVIKMKEWMSKNYLLIIMLLSFILYWLLGILITYITLVCVSIFVLWGKLGEKFTFYNFDLVLFAIYLLLTLFGLFVIKNPTVEVLSVILGITYVTEKIVNSNVK